MRDLVVSIQLTLGAVPYSSCCVPAINQTKKSINKTKKNTGQKLKKGTVDNTNS